MTKSILLAIVFLALLGATVPSRADQTKTDAVDRLNSAAKSLREIVAAPDKG